MPPKIAVFNSTRGWCFATSGLEGAVSCLSELTPVSRIRICLLRFFLAVSAVELEVITNSHKYQMNVLV